MQRSYNLLKELASRCDVDFLAFNQRALVPVGNLNQSIEALNRIVNVIGVYPIPADDAFGGKLFAAMCATLPFQAPYSSRWLMSRSYSDAVRDALVARTYDLIHVDTIGLIQHVPRGELGRVALTHHNIESQMMSRRAALEENRLKQIYFRREANKLRREEAEIVPQCRLNLVCSELDAERLRIIAPSARAAVVENGVDINYFDPSVCGARPINGRYVVFAGRLDAYTNQSAVRFLVEDVWPALRNRYPDLSLVVAGRNPPSWLVSRCRDIRERIVVTGEVDDIRPFIHHADAYLCPVFDGGGTRLKILDAMALGSAIVAHSVAVEGLSILDGLHFLAATDAGGFVTQSSRVLDDPSVRNALGVAARGVAVERYSFSAIGNKMAQLYQTFFNEVSP